MRAEMSNKITDSYKQAKKRQKPPAVAKGIAVPSTSSHLQPDSNPDLETLKQFDLCLEYGPCIGKYCGFASTAASAPSILRVVRM